MFALSFAGLGILFASLVSGKRGQERREGFLLLFCVCETFVFTSHVSVDSVDAVDGAKAVEAVETTKAFRWKVWKLWKLPKLSMLSELLLFKF